MTHRSHHHPVQYMCSARKSLHPKSQTRHPKSEILNHVGLLKISSTMGWPRLIGSLKLYVSFVKELYKRDDILQKRPIILRSLLLVAKPYIRSGLKGLRHWQWGPKRCVGSCICFLVEQKKLSRCVAICAFGAHFEYAVGNMCVWPEYMEC